MYVLAVAVLYIHFFMLRSTYLIRNKNFQQIVTRSWRSGMLAFQIPPGQKSVRRFDCPGIAGWPSVSFWSSSGPKPDRISGWPISVIHRFCGVEWVCRYAGSQHQELGKNLEQLVLLCITWVFPLHWTSLRNPLASNGASCFRWVLQFPCVHWL